MLVCIVLALMAQSPDGGTTVTGFVGGAQVVLRDKPALSGAVVAVLPFGTPLEVLEAQTEFTRVRISGTAHQGWIGSALVRTSPEPTQDDLLQMDSLGRPAWCDAAWKISNCVPFPDSDAVSDKPGVGHRRRVERRGAVERREYFRASTVMDAATGILKKEASRRPPGVNGPSEGPQPQPVPPLVGRVQLWRELFGPNSPYQDTPVEILLAGRPLELPASPAEAATWPACVPLPKGTSSKLPIAKEKLRALPVRWEGADLVPQLQNPMQYQFDSPGPERTDSMTWEATSGMADTVSLLSAVYGAPSLSVDKSHTVVWTGRFQAARVDTTGPPPVFQLEPRINNTQFRLARSPWKRGEGVEDAVLLLTRDAGVLKFLGKAQGGSKTPTTLTPDAKCNWERANGHAYDVDGDAANDFMVITLESGSDTYGEHAVYLLVSQRGVWVALPLMAYSFSDV